MQNTPLKFNKIYYVDELEQFIIFLRKSEMTDSYIIYNLSQNKIKHLCRIDVDLFYTFDEII